MQELGTHASRQAAARVHDRALIAIMGRKVRVCVAGSPNPAAPDATPPSAARTQPSHPPGLALSLTRPATCGGCDAGGGAHTQLPAGALP